MLLRCLTKAAKTLVLSAGAAADQTEVDASVVDMLGYEAVRALCLLGALTATQVTSLKAQGSNTNNGTDWLDLASSNVGPAADADEGKLLILDLYRPAYRYIQFVVVRGTEDAAITCILGELYVSRGEPVPTDDAVSAQVILPYAVAGTA